MINLPTTLLGMVNSTPYSSTNHQLASYVLSHLGDIEYLNEPDLAQACSTSKTSVNRFCKELGYSNFARFQADVLRYRRRIEFKYALEGTAPSASNADLLDRYCESVAYNARALADSVNYVDLIELARDLDAFDQVFVLGEEQSGDVAHMFQHNLFDAGRMVTALTYAREQRDVLSHVAPGTLVVIFSLFGQFFHRIEEQSIHIDRVEGTKICWITSQPLYQPTFTVDLTIDCGVGKSLAAGNLAMEMVANVVVMHYWRLRQG